MIGFSWLNFRGRAPQRPAAADPGRLLYWGFRGPRLGVSYKQVVNAAEALVHPTVHRCVTKIAQSVQTVDWVAEKKISRRPNGAAPASAADVQADLQAVLDDPSDTLTPAALRNNLAMYLATFGVAYIMCTRNSRGTVSGIFPLSPSRVREIHDERGVVTKYQYQAGTQIKDWPSRRAAENSQRPAKDGEAAFYPAYISKIEFTSIDNINQPEGRPFPNSPLNSLGLPMQIIELLMQRAVDTASGHPNAKYVISMSKMLTRRQEDAVKEAFDDHVAGADDSGNIMMVYGEDLKVTKLDNDLSDLHSKMPLDDMERRIAASYGIPAAVLGLGGADNAKFAQNYSESRMAFWEDTIEPVYLSTIEQGLTRAICPDGWEIRFDRNSVHALQDAVAARAAVVETSTIMTVDEKRALIGLPPSKASDVFHLPTLKVRVPDDPNAPKPDAKALPAPAAKPAIAAIK